MSARRAAARVAAMALALLALAVPAAAQDPFQLTYQVERLGPDKTQIIGSVLNNGPRDVFDVYVTVEALDARGKIVGRGIAFAAAAIRARELVSFSLTVPVGPQVERFRPYVSNFSQGFGQSP